MVFTTKVAWELEAGASLCEQRLPQAPLTEWGLPSVIAMHFIALSFQDFGPVNPSPVSSKSSPVLGWLVLASSPPHSVAGLGNAHSGQ